MFSQRSPQLDISYIDQLDYYEYRHRLCMMYKRRNGYFNEIDNSLYLPSWSNYHEIKIK